MSHIGLILLRRFDGNVDYSSGLHVTFNCTKPMQQLLCNHFQVDSLNLAWNPTNSRGQQQPHCHTHTLSLQLVPTLTSMHSLET